MPYILVGYIQVTLILLAARLIFGAPILGSVVLLYTVVLAFIAANLSVGLMFSTVAKNQMQAMQMTFFFFLPSMLLSGFMFPFRGILLKGNGLLETLPHQSRTMRFMLHRILRA